jgi:pyruvate/2-oxoglutarate dehydrogenase complex dihydrolipoamide acyltransferase (E2) component
LTGVPIVLPDVGTTACRLGLWLVRPGEAVSEGDRVAEVLIPGAVIDVAAPADGVFRDKFARPGDALSAGQALGIIEPTEP